MPTSVNFEVLQPPEYLPDLRKETSGQPLVLAVAELESFTLQTRLSSEMAYLSLFTLGMIRYTAGDWEGAIARFTDALAHEQEILRALDQSAVYFYRGNAYINQEDYDQAIADYTQAL